MTYSTTWRGHTILSRYGRAYWRGWHWFWERRHARQAQWLSLRLGKRNVYYLHAFWAGYDMAKEARLSGHKGP